MPSSPARLRRDYTRGFPARANPIGAKTDDPLAMYLSDIFTAPANLMGIPAIAVPSGFSRDHLPLSLQIMAPHFAERAQVIEGQAETLLDLLRGLIADGQVG